MSRVLVVDWNWDGAQRELQRDLDLDRSNANIFRNAAYLYRTLGRYDLAESAAQSAVDRDPLNYYNYCRLGEAKASVRKYPEAEAGFRHALALQASADGLHADLAGSLLDQGKPDEALAELHRETDPAIKALNLPIAFYLTRRKDDAERALTYAQGVYGATAPGAIANIYAVRHDLDRAFLWWNRALRTHSRGMPPDISTPYEARCPELATNPRWIAMFRKLKLTG